MTAFGSTLSSTEVNKNLVGLGNVDNTSDSNKPVSNAQQNALNGKANNISFADGEVPSGTINGSNGVFTVSNTPTTGSLKLFLNGIRLTNAVDYTISGTTITMTTIPFPSDVLLTDYRH